ncbi:single-stranded DNA-binding protein [Paraconexibacter sp.]|uniref:single-stranded DNA-binding protein n=1 Tax=Paraconexibacter sp. TaxID=2949640 RepID=UPI00356A1868
MPANINRVVLEGELTADPVVEAGICHLALLVTTLRRSGDGDWVGRPNHFDVVVGGALAERCAAGLRKGRPVAIEGSLSWEPGRLEDPNARARIQVHADSVRPTDVRAALLIPAAPVPEQGGTGAEAAGPVPAPEAA